jgi:hypothetical protein
MLYSKDQYPMSACSPNLRSYLKQDFIVKQYDKANLRKTVAQIFSLIVVLGQRGSKSTLAAAICRLYVVSTHSFIQLQASILHLCITFDSAAA